MDLPKPDRFATSALQSASADSRAAQRSSRPSTHRTLAGYRIADGLTEALIYFAVLWGPWAFGTTQSWSTWTLNITGYLLGAALITKWILRWRTGFVPDRWGIGAPRSAGGTPRSRQAWSRRLTTALAIGTVMVLAYCLVSALNARATYRHDVFRHFYHDHYLAWLPHSYDSRQTWFIFWQYVGLAWTFWAVRDWILGQTRRERYALKEESGREESRDGLGRSGRPAAVLAEACRRSSSPLVGQLPHRLRRLLWVICLNAAMLGLEASVQRFSGTTKLLWLVEPRINKAPDSQFGPYAYRSNAAQYLNLVWPVSLGFWWLLQREARRNWRQHSRIGGSAHVVLLPTTIVTAASPIVSTSRGGALVAAVGMIIAMVLLVIANRHGHWWWRLGIFGVVLASLGLGGYLGWDTLEPRLKKVFSDDAGGRLPIYRNARQIASDFPWYGTGPGTFASVYQLYRQSSEDIWYSEAHDDWLELRITFGWTGFALVITLLALLAVYPFLGTGIATPRLFIALLGLALAGCLVHAKGDFPFQVPSILWLFLVLGSVGFCLTWSTDRR